MNSDRIVHPSSGEAASGVNDLLEGNLKRLTRYLQSLAGHIADEVNTVLTDHCYARAWNWKPESIYVKPMRKIFFSKGWDSVGAKKLKPDEDIDVVTPPLPPSPPPPYDLLKPLHQIEECHRLATFARPDSPEDWEDKIDKTFWSCLQSRLWTRVLRILTEEHLSRLVKTTSRKETISRRMSIDSSAKRFRHVFASTGYDLRLIQWLHSLLFDHLPREYLTIYLDILQTLRTKIPQLVDKIISTQPTIPTRSGGAINWETLTSVLKRSWDPVSTTLNSCRPKKLPGNPILIITPSGITSQLSPRQLKWISQLNSLSTVVTINPHFGLTSNKMTMTSCMDQLVQATRAKIQEIRSDCPGRPLILIGFNTAAAFACQISQIEHVTAIICLGFPFSTAEGKRSTPDDILMDVRSPVMFVIGQNAATVRADDIEETREKMLVQTSLIVVGTADDHLRISSRKKNVEGITQGMVDRCILDEIANFIGGILLQPHPLPLRHVHINYDSKPMKKEPRKRKNSTSSSVDSCEIVGKKSRPATPTGSGNPPGIPVMMQVPRPAKPSLPGRNGHNAKRNVKPRGSINPKLLAMAGQQGGNGNGNGNGGITLNIGGMASLSPVGPIKFGPGPGEGIKQAIVNKGPMGVSLTKVRKSLEGGRGFMRGEEGALIGQSGLGAQGLLEEDSRRGLGRTAVRKDFIGKSELLRRSSAAEPNPAETASTSAMSTVLENMAHESSDSPEVNDITKQNGAMMNDNSMTIIPISNKLTAGDSNAQKIPLTASNNSWKKTETKDLSDDFGSILDIPIIFAKDDENLTVLEKTPPPVNLRDTSRVHDNKHEQNPPTKVVLLSNKSGGNSTSKVDRLKSQNFNRPIVLRTPMQNNSSQGPTIKSNESVKYTKIILAKRNTIINSNNSDKIVLTRNKRK
ncbi:KAT8 regulatory NSL complex subunit 3 [Diachasma alloeum]|uniref:KAT8 regulatory NSL complex subunit 3 n=1 Tax=Diachasma alloeum TaxID=454923 RepID=UPI0007383FD4|nr:KAT8 regulatory NSL complex subunit 3 [Diachasma alloeum]